MTRVLVIMGSGETAPTMVKPHRALLARAGEAPAVVLDTPYGFQENADDISERAMAYFDASVGRKVRVASWRHRDIAPAARARVVADLRDACWIFAGPGSPTYALRHWQGTEIPGLLADRLRQGGVVCFASAAALTLGSHTVPVYEIYKAGESPQWVAGLDIVRQATGLPAVVVPHYDNAEGGHHDTRFCYLGERRLSTMEATLPEEAFILGVDEHTAVELDIEASTVTVTGNGTMTIRRHGHSIVHPAGTVLAFDDLLCEHPAGATATASTSGTPADPAAAAASGATLHTDADRLAAVFAAAAAGRDADGCVEAILELEQLITDWSADLSDDLFYARTALRQMIVRLGDLAGTVDPHATALPEVMDLVVEVRRQARAAKDFATSDAIRDRLATAGIEIRDTPDGPTWHLR